MGLPETQDQPVRERMERWRTDEIRVLRTLEGDAGIRIEVVDRLIRDGRETDIVRTRCLPPEKADQLWGSADRKTFRVWVLNYINPNAELR